MNLRAADQIAKAVLYEGYMLYPYRPSSVKNQQRWNFGVLCPESYSQAQKGNEASTMQTECLVVGSSTTALEVRVRFLQLVERTIGELQAPASELPADQVPEFRLVERLAVDGRIHQPWQEAVEREVGLPVGNMEALGRGPVSQAIAFPRDKQVEFLPRCGRPHRRGSGTRAASPVRHGQNYGRSGRGSGVQDSGAYFEHHAVCDHAAGPTRNEALLSSLVSVHTVLGVQDGSFVSQFSPAERLVELVAGCTNVGTWPVLVGGEGESDTMLSSPIILYDYPQIAPESAGDLFDGTEIDEILSLRIMTLTEDEKREMSQSDERARAMLERTESMPVEQLMKLHGVLRGLRSSQGGHAMNEWEWQLLEEKTPVDHKEISGIEVRPGSRVRLRPRKGGDVMDIALAGQIATIECLEQDYEGKCHVSVVLDNDPGRDMGLLRQPGHRFFFDAEEIEPLSEFEAQKHPPLEKPSILVAGIGNIFLGDDAFGVEVIRRMAGLKLPGSVRVADFGIRGFDLAYALQDGYETTILVDACPHGEAPGTLYVIEPEVSTGDGAEAPPALEAHVMNPMTVLRTARAMNIEVKKVLLVGCEPGTLGGEEGQMGLSAPVEAAVDEAVKLVESLVRRILEQEGPDARLAKV